MSNNLPILVSTLHDPQFNLQYIFEETIVSIKNLFQKRYISCTQQTSTEFIQVLEKEGFQITVSDSTHIDIYRTAIKAGIDEIEKTQPTHRDTSLFYIDFDRLMHWCKNYPEELSNILSHLNEKDLTLLGRSKQAFDTHASTQKETEIIVNKIGSKILGLSDTYDIISVCWGFTPELGKKLLTIKNSTLTGFYGTWPLFLWKWASSKDYIETNGLEWETPDRYIIDIQKLGYKNWLKRFENPGEWAKRVKILHDCLDEMLNFVKIKLL